MNHTPDIQIESFSLLFQREHSTTISLNKIQHLQLMISDITVTSKIKYNKTANKTEHIDPAVNLRNVLSY